MTRSRLIFFILTMEKLGHVINLAISNSKWKPIKMEKGGPSLSHLFFVDNLVFFGEASVENAIVMRDILQLFYKYSSHKMKPSKSKKKKKFG